MPILPELIRYLRRPVFTTSRVPVNARAMAELLKLLGITLILALMSVTIASGFYSALSGETAKISEDFEAMSKGPRFFYMAVILAPIYEELLFRSWLGRVWSLMLAMPLLLAVLAILALTGQSEAMPNIATLGFVAVMTSLGFYLRRYFDTKSVVGAHERAAQQIFPYVFWGCAVIFGLIHMTNYAGSGFQPLLMLMVIPQFIIGAILGFVRMRYGLLQAIGFHAAYNSVFVGLSFLG